MTCGLTVSQKTWYVGEKGITLQLYSHNSNLASYVQTAMQAVFKAVTAKYTAPDLIGKRSQVSTDILSMLEQELEKYGAQVINIDMRNFAFSTSYMSAIDEKLTQ